MTMKEVNYFTSFQESRPTIGMGLNPSTFLYQGGSRDWQNSNQTTTWSDDIFKTYITGI